MTIEDQIGKIIDDWHDDQGPDRLADVLAAAIREAVAAEREACAKVADAEPRSWDEYSDAVTASQDIAAAIRSRP